MYYTEQRSYPQELIIQTICLKTIFQANISDAEEEKAHSCQSSRRASRMRNSKAVCPTAFAGAAKVRALWMGKYWKRLSEAHKVRPPTSPGYSTHSRAFTSSPPRFSCLQAPISLCHMFYQNGGINFLLPQQRSLGGGGGNPLSTGYLKMKKEKLTKKK